MYVKNISIFVVPISEKYVYSIFFTLKNKIAVSKYVHKKMLPHSNQFYFYCLLKEEHIKYALS